MHPSSDNITAINNNVYKCSSRLTVYSKLALVIAVLVNRLYTLWLWVSTAAICDSLVRETSRNFQSFLFSNCSQCVVIRRVSRSFLAICLITLPSWVTHAVLPDGTVENGPTPCYEVKPSAFGKMMDNLPLNVTHWSCLVLLNLFPCIALCIYAFRSCFLSHFKPRYFNLEGNQSRQHFNAYFLMNKWIFICPNIAYHLPLSVFAISAGFNVTAYTNKSLIMNGKIHDSILRIVNERCCKFDHLPECNKIYIMDRWQFHLNLAYEVLSFSDCVQILLLNSLRASSSIVVIRVHVEKFKFQIIDDGDGMDQTTLTSFDKMPAYLKDVCKLADEVIIHSRPRGRAVGFKARYCAALKRSVDGSRTFSDCFFLKDSVQIQSRKCHGTTITVQKLFSKTPVRQKSVKPSQELENLKLRLRWISVKHPKVIIELHDESDRSCAFRTTRCETLSESFLQLFFEIYPHQLSDQIRFENEDFKLSLWIGTEESNTASLQCIYWNDIPIFWQTELHTFVISLIEKLKNGRKDSCSVFLLTIDTPLVERFMVEGLRAVESCYKWKRLLEAIENLFQKPLSTGDSLQNEKLLSKGNRCLLPGCKFSYQLYENFTNSLPLLNDEKRSISQTSIYSNSTSKCTVEENSNILVEETMKNISVIGQYDCKFVICRATVESKQNDRTGLLLLFDQHAVSERVRLEQLLREHIVEGRIARARLSHPIEINFFNSSKWFSSKDIIERYGMEINFENSRYLIFTVPICFARGKWNISQNSCITARFLKSVFQQILEFGSLPSRRKLPPIFRRSFADWACKGAIRFGDRLTLNQCQNLIRQLVECEAPFHCAHGRRSSNRIQALDGGLNIAKGVMELVSSGRDGSRGDSSEFDPWHRMARPILPNAESMSDSCLKLCAYGDLIEPLVQLAQTLEQVSTTLIILQYSMIAISVIFFFATLVSFLILLQLSNRSPDTVVEKRTVDNNRSAPKRAVHFDLST
ncbi:DNA mismatch repair protein Mlh3 [Trichinella britovi]|uniref:DNA mismatch repair protein Mlh3 n=1 Tax=Trichinella britovi TaxID=45882 RepID=A0A0V1CDT0_TRIBR|nr:DNA mismatch repair protein Mlh3 [Trichinella britovi]